MNDHAWRAFDIETLKGQLTGKPVEFREFFSAPTMHCGLYRLAAGATDMQTPHDEDEMYYVIEGKASLKIAGELKEVGPGSLLYVGATETHSFFEIEEDMLLLVLFASGGRSRDAG